MLVRIANSGITTGVNTRGVMPCYQVGLTWWTSGTYVIGHVLVCTADRGVATGIANRCVVSNHVGFSSWTVNASVTKHLLIGAAKDGITAGIDTRSIITVSVGLASWASQACVAPNLLA
jgi:hypothetical protein